MDIVALITWILTAGGGLAMLAIWIRNGGHRQQGRSNFPPALIFGHFGLAATGLVVWIIFVATDTDALAWIAFVLLLPVAALGFTMFARWLPTYRQRGAMAGTTGTTGAAGATDTATTSEPAERHFPVVTVAAHGVLAVVTLVLVLLTALGVG